MAKRKCNFYGRNSINVTLKSFFERDGEGVKKPVTDYWLRTTSKKAVELLTKNVEQAQLDAAQDTVTDETTIWNKRNSPYGKGLQVSTGKIWAKINKETFNLRWDSPYAEFLEFGVGLDADTDSELMNNNLHYDFYEMSPVAAIRFHGWFPVAPDGVISKGELKQQLKEHNATLSKGWDGYAPYWHTLLELRNGHRFRAEKRNEFSWALFNWQVDNDKPSRTNIKWWKV